MNWRHTKISATVIDFGRPLIEQLSPADGQHGWQAVFESIVVIWNANVLARHWGLPATLEQARTLLRQNVASGQIAPQALHAFEQLHERYAMPRFAQDPRAVGHWHLIVKDDEQFNLQCDGRLPPTLTGPDQA